MARWLVISGRLLKREAVLLYSAVTVVDASQYSTSNRTPQRLSEEIQYPF